MISTVIIACITASAAIVAPVITALINNMYQLKMKQLEIYEEKRIEVINRYVSAVSSYVTKASSSSENDLFVIMNSVFLYAPPKVWKDISNLNSLINNHNLVKAKELLPKVTQKLSPSVFKLKN